MELKYSILAHTYTYICCIRNEQYRPAEKKKQKKKKKKIFKNGKQIFEVGEEENLWEISSLRNVLIHRADIFFNLTTSYVEYFEYPSSSYTFIDNQLNETTLVPFCTLSFQLYTQSHPIVYTLTPNNYQILSPYKIYMHSFFIITIFFFFKLSIIQNNKSIVTRVCHLEKKKKKKKDRI
ncbi:hypothetical protein RFI_15273 [Reticulomyxa filosa]|uniref:Uncharacterized protein n=1 Tax=Reticulomyxa filosa TaxID=46433 RepID=X6N869_RETFI|nr:hypothetical protein RFI_15273 [Reticulomyxa filosa]|eukprot:ETO21929.1 hypothetical protein RFI_15273 [Reticulomyxa filosa]